MCQVGSSDQQYQNKIQQEKKTFIVEQHQPQQQQKADQWVYMEKEKYKNLKVDSSYSDFMKRFHPLPGTDVEGNQPPAEEKLSWKQRKRRNKMYKEWYQMKVDDAKEKPGLVFAEDLNKTFSYWDKKDREHWEKQVLPHSKLTRGETLRRIIEEGDYSNFENLDELMRNRVATRALLNFRDTFHINEHTTVDEIMSHYREYSSGVSMFLDPALRLGFSLAQKTGGMPDWAKTLYRELDEAMSTEVMVATLTHKPDVKTVASYYEKKKSKSKLAALYAAYDAIADNKAQQIQIAKRLLLMQLSVFHVPEKDKYGFEVSYSWDKTMAVALSHCSRVALTLPRLKEDSRVNNAQAHQRMWNAIYTVNGKNDAKDNSRMSSTHDIERRVVVRGVADGKDPGWVAISWEQKVRFNFTGQRGMNCAIGGLGNNGVGGELLGNDGSCGHFYSMYKEADADHNGAMLMGLESDAAGVMNQMGHTHDIFATPEKASCLGAQRTDEVGEKYGGRQCDLSRRSAASITDALIDLEKKMLQWQAEPQGMESEDAKEHMRLLAGKKWVSRIGGLTEISWASAEAQPTPH